PPPLTASAMSVTQPLSITLRQKVTVIAPRFAVPPVILTPARMRSRHLRPEGSPATVVTAIHRHDRALSEAITTGQLRIRRITRAVAVLTQLITMSAKRPGRATVLPAAAIATIQPIIRWRRLSLIQART